MNQVILALHVILATLAFGFIIFFDFLLVSIARSKDVRAIRSAFPAAMRIARWVGLLLGLAVVFGFIRAAQLHIPLLSGWLLLSYALLLIAGAAGIGATFRRHARVLHAAFELPDDRLSPELQSAIAAEQPGGAYVMILFMAAIIYVMFAKPF